MSVGVDDFTLALLRKRGIETKEAVEKFLQPSYDLHVHDPLAMKNMREAAERFARAIVSGERICVWSDYDCDGIPGAVVLHDFLQKVGAHFENYIPHRHLEGYGVNQDGIEKIAANGVKLVVTVDSGITDVDAIQKARDLGLEVIVTDHHEPGARLPNAIVVDDKQEGETYPYPELCGAATAWKLVCATLEVSPELRAKVGVGWEKWLLDMVGLATIADMMPLQDENRVLAKYGLLVLRKSPRIGLQKLCRVMRVEQSRISEDDVGFMIAPRVNAASRMGEARDAFTLFTTHDEDEADALAKKLDKANRARRAEAGVITRAVHEKLKTRTDIPSVIALGDPSWRPALLGLVASGIVEEYDRPVFLWGREGNQTLKGSCRSDGRVHVLSLMGQTVDTFAQFGGHAGSGGFTVLDDAIFTLEDRLVKAHAELEAGMEESDSMVIDAELTPDDMTLSLLSRLELLAPFGEGNQKPLFRLGVCKIHSVSRFGKGEEHIKIKIEKEFDRDPIDAIAFFAKKDVKQFVDALLPGQVVSLEAHLERDQFSRRGAPRLRFTRIGKIK